LWVKCEVEQAFITSQAPEDSREGKAAYELLERLDSMLKMPGIIENKSEVAHHGSEEWASGIVDEVERRLEGGHVGNREPYQELAVWVRRTMSGKPALQQGDERWLFYDDSFDATLFELWCLMSIADEVSRHLGQPRQVPNMRQTGRIPVYQWSRGSMTVAIHFQYDLINTSVGNVAAWQRNDKALGGRPDLTAIVEAMGVNQEKTKSVVYLDPKLRKRNGVPTEEIYKMLGYFSNAGMGDAGSGAIIFYTPHRSPKPTYEFSSAGGGRVIAIGVDPASPDENAAGLELLAGLILG
jgi:hypothetical protein